MILVILRIAVFAVFAGAAAIAVGGWAVRNRRLNPKSSAYSTTKTLTDPFLNPVENWLVENGGNPKNAEIWLFGVTLVGGIVVISVAGWIAGEIDMWSRSVHSGRGIVRQVVYYAGQLVTIAIIVRVVGSWLGVGRYNRWMRPAYLLTSWLISPLQRILPKIGPFDISPFVAFVGLQIVMGLVLARI